MVTGDQAVTARSVDVTVGLAGPDAETLVGRELKNLDALDEGRASVCGAPPSLRA